MSPTDTTAQPGDLILDTTPLLQRRWCRLTAVFLFLLIFGAIRVPLEVELNKEHRAAFFHGAKLDMSLRQQIGQMSFLAALGGFRAVVADGLFIMAHVDWTHTEWGKMLFLYNNVTALQPRNVMFWDTAAWQMAYNASAYYLNDPREPHIALRLKRQHEYFLIGEDFLKRGIQNNPDHFKLYESLGMVYRDKLFDHYNASMQFRNAAQFPDSPTYEVRFAAYELSYSRGHEREAYTELVRLYRMGEKEWLPTLLKRIKELQEQLNIPSHERINIPENELPPHH
jgi:hypothetical protein